MGNRLNWTGVNLNNAERTGRGIVCFVPTNGRLCYAVKYKTSSVAEKPRDTLYHCELSLYS